MKTKIKSTYLLLGTALLLSACSQEEELPRVNEVQGGGKQILFTTSFPSFSTRSSAEQITRAQKVTTDNLPYFQVTAFNPSDSRLITDGNLNEHFFNQHIDIVEGTNKFSSPDCIWPEMGRESDMVTFFAFYPAITTLDDHTAALPTLGDIKNETTISEGTPNYNYRLTKFNVNPQIADQVDFVTAYTTGTMADNLFSGITLPFCHQLSRIEVKAWSANKSCDIEIAGVRIGGVGVEGTFAFKPDSQTGKLETEKGGGEWEATVERGVVEYIYREGDNIVFLEHGTIASTSTKDGALSIMGSKNGDDENCAMLIPTTNTEWDFVKDSHNADNKMFISVLLRVTDKTPTSGINPIESQRFPYKDLSQGANSPNIPVVYLAVNKTTGVVTKRLYKNGDNYYTDAAATTLYTLPDTEEVKDFGWATLPVKGTWAPGNIYTYTLDYTSGVGLHGPEIADHPTDANALPKAGDPIISDKVGINYSVKEWNNGGGDEFPVPGS